MPDIPAYYQYNNIYNSALFPSTVHCKNTGLVNYYANTLLSRAMSVFKFSLPKTWDSRYYQYGLYTNGYVAVVDTDKFGVIPQVCTLSGYDVYYNPAEAVIANPLLPGMPKQKIGQNCTLIKLQRNYDSIMGIVNYYADMLGLTSELCGVNLINSKLSYVFAADGKGAAESLKKLYDMVASGEPAAVVDKSLMRDDGTPSWQVFAQDLRSNFIAPEAFDCVRSLLNNFDTDIGIRNSNVDKKAQIGRDEINANNQETYSLAWQMYESITEGIEATKQMFGDRVKDLSISWRYPPVEKPVETVENVDKAGETL